MSVTEQGFTVLEMLVCLCIIGSLTMLGLGRRSDLELDHLYYLNDYLLNQSEAISQRQTVAYEKGVSFNSMGHVDMARTIGFGSHSIVVYLGNGYATVR